MGGFDAVSQEGRLLLGGLGGNAALVQSVIQMLGPSANGVGLMTVVQAFEREGLGPLVASWVGATQNMPVSPAQVQQGLGTTRVRQLAQSAGLTEGAAADRKSVV